MSNKPSFFVETQVQLEESLEVRLTQAKTFWNFVADHYAQPCPFLFSFPGLRPVCSLKPLDAFPRSPLSPREFLHSVSHVVNFIPSLRTQTKHLLWPFKVVSILLSTVLLGQVTYTRTLTLQFHINCLVLCPEISFLQNSFSVFYFSLEFMYFLLYHAWFLCSASSSDWQLVANTPASCSSWCLLVT